MAILVRMQWLFCPAFCPEHLE
eukprot:COSAG02_NODE_873_length_16302_cov_113.473616_18_plen_21_part_01